MTSKTDVNVDRPKEGVLENSKNH